MELKFYYCKHCGNIVTYVKDNGVPVTCCGEEMVELTPNIEEASNEKHIPVIEKNRYIVTVTVGSVIHPMTEAHYIEWIALVTNNGVYVKKLTPNDEPIAKFCLLDGEEVVTAFEYCNLHKLWKA